MNNLTKISSIFVLLTLAFASENKNEVIEQNQVKLNKIAKGSTELEMPSIDIQKINDVRIEKSIRDKKYAEVLLKNAKVKNAERNQLIKKQLKNSNKSDVLKRWSTDLRSKFLIGTIKGEDGARALKLPSAPESK